MGRKSDFTQDQPGGGNAGADSGGFAANFSDEWREGAVLLKNRNARD
jgi:hypothetical protein